MGTLAGALLWLGFIFFTCLVWWKIMKKTGYHPALGLLMLLPLANLVMLVILAFRPWPMQKELKEGAKPARMSTPLAVLIVAVSSIPLLLIITAIAIPNFLRASSTANETVAETTVKTISGAIDTYAAANNGRYPAGETELKLIQPYNNQTIQGYNYSLRLASNEYEITATPETCGATGTKVFKAKPNAALSREDCK